MELFDWFGRYFEEGQNQVYRLAGWIGGGIVSIPLLDIPAHHSSYVWLEVGLKWTVALVMAGITGMVTKMGADFWSDHLKHKIKIFKNGKTEDEQRRA